MLALFIYGQIQLADSLYKSRFYDLAEIEYKRILYFDSSFYNILPIRVNYALSILHNNRLKGIDEINRLTKEFPEMDDKTKGLIGEALVEEGLYSLAIEILSETENKRLLSYCYLMNGQINEAYENFYNVGEMDICQEIEQYLRKPKKSIFKATILSTILPGAGELYAGSIRFAFFDFILTWGSGYLLYDALREKRYVDAGVILSLLFSRFYFGSISNASRLVYERNKKEKEEYLEVLKKKYFKDN